MADAVEVTVRDDEVDLASGLLWGAGVSAVAEHPLGDGRVVLRADVPAGGTDAVAAALAGRWEVVAVEVDDGLDGWRDHARVVRAGRFVVRPPWIPLGPVAPGEVVLEIDPGRAFGHGAHPTTRLCLELVSDLVPGSSGAASTAHRRRTGPDGPSVLDVGCGSGVLAVAAVAAGARSAVGVDIDPAALDATRANAERNGVADRVTVVGGDLTRHGRADLVLANIGAATLRDLAGDLVASTAPGGALVLSGLLDPPPDDLAAAFAPLQPVEDRRLDGWTARVLRKP